MKRFLIPVVIASAIVSSSVFAGPAAHGKTREEVRAELVQAREAGVFDAPDATYAQLRAAAALQNANTNAGSAGASSFGGAVTGRSQSGRRTVTAPEARDSIYFGQ
jgi:predicted Zn-dependent peptidase